jgi:hypothetical protein
MFVPQAFVSRPTADSGGGESKADKMPTYAFSFAVIVFRGAAFAP